MEPSKKRKRELDVMGGSEPIENQVDSTLRNRSHSPILPREDDIFTLSRIMESFISNLEHECHLLHGNLSSLYNSTHNDITRAIDSFVAHFILQGNDDDMMVLQPILPYLKFNNNNGNGNSNSLNLDDLINNDWIVKGLIGIILFLHHRISLDLATAIWAISIQMTFKLYYYTYHKSFAYPTLTIENQPSPLSTSLMQYRILPSPLSSQQQKNHSWHVLDDHITSLPYTCLESVPSPSQTGGVPSTMVRLKTPFSAGTLQKADSSGSQQQQQHPSCFFYTDLNLVFQKNVIRLCAFITQTCAMIWPPKLHDKLCHLQETIISKLNNTDEDGNGGNDEELQEYSPNGDGSYEMERIYTMLKLLDVQSTLASRHTNILQRCIRRTWNTLQKYNLDMPLFEAVLFSQLNGSNGDNNNNYNHTHVITTTLPLDFPFITEESQRKSDDLYEFFYSEHVYANHTNKQSLPRGNHPHNNTSAAIHSRMLTGAPKERAHSMGSILSQDDIATMPPCIRHLYDQLLLKKWLPNMASLHFTSTLYGLARRRRESIDEAIADVYKWYVDVGILNDQSGNRHQNNSSSSGGGGGSNTNHTSGYHRELVYHLDVTLRKKARERESNVRDPSVPIDSLLPYMAKTCKTLIQNQNKEPMYLFCPVFKKANDGQGKEKATSHALSSVPDMEDIVNETMHKCKLNHQCDTILVKEQGMDVDYVNNNVKIWMSNSYKNPVSIWHKTRDYLQKFHQFKQSSNHNNPSSKTQVLETMTTSSSSLIKKI